MVKVLWSLSFKNSIPSFMFKRLLIICSLISCFQLGAQPVTNSLTNSIVTYPAWTNLLKRNLGTNNYDFSTVPAGNTNNPTNYNVVGKFTASTFQYLNNTNNPGFSLVADANGNITPQQNGSLVAVYSGTTVGITNIFTNANATNQALYEVYLTGVTVSSTGTISVGWPALGITNSLALTSSFNITNFTGLTLNSTTNTAIVWVTGSALKFWKVALYKITD